MRRIGASKFLTAPKTVSCAGSGILTSSSSIAICSSTAKPAECDNFNFRRNISSARVSHLLNSSFSASSICCSAQRTYATLTNHLNPTRLGAESKELTDCCAPIRDKLPEDGSLVSAADFAALVEEQLPSRGYNGLGLFTIREVAEACPSMFRVEPDEETGWYLVGRADVASSSSSQAVAKDPAKYISVKGEDLVPLEEALTAEATDAPIDSVLRYLHTSPAYVVRTKVTIQPKAKPHGAHVFIDGDSLAKETITQLFNTLKLTTVASTKTVVRQPATMAHGNTDIVCRAPAQTFQILENQLDQLTTGSAAVLKPIVIMCSDGQKPVYTAVARRYSNRMNITLCTPTTVGHVA